MHFPRKTPTGKEDNLMVKSNFSLFSSKTSSINVTLRNPVVFPASTVTL